MNRFRLASYNIHKCVGMDRRRMPERTLAVIRQVGADIIALQEVDHRLGQRPAALPRALIERDGDFAILPFATGAGSLGWHGQTILVRKGLEVEAIRRIELPGLEPRGAILAELATETGGFRVVGVHLGLIRRYRMMQLAAIRAAVSHRAPMPTVILGDFNEWSTSRGAETLWPDYRVHAPGQSFPATRPIGAIDRVALGGDLHLLSAGVHRAAPAHIASDHLPVWVELRVGPEEA